MYNVYFDSGTSNTRAYLLKDYHLVDRLKHNIGSKDSSIAGSNRVLIQGLKAMYDQLLATNKLTDNQIEGVYASGMITSPFGLKEVPHLPTPVSLEKLYNGIYTHHETELFGRDIHLIPGVKTIPDDFSADRYNISSVNNMRGEEIEIFGILSELPTARTEEKIAIFFPGSHTHIAYLEQGVLHDILSTFSGELFHAIASATILANSVHCESDRLDEEMVLLGFTNLKKYGINRALYIAHATKIFSACGNLERKSYLEGVITGGIGLAFAETVKNKWHGLNSVLVVGSSPYMVRVYELILKEISLNVDVTTMIADGAESLALKGFIQILRRGNGYEKNGSNHL